MTRRLTICITTMLFFIAIFSPGMPGIPPAAAADTDAPVRMHIENLTLPPANLPFVMVKITNISDAPYRGELSIIVPESWRMATTVRPVELAPGETDRYAFAVEKGTTRADNRYPVGATLTGGDRTIIVQREIVAAAAPYFKPIIDGLTDDWNDAIPARFSTAADAPSTVVSTYWNRRSFSLLVEVEEERLVPQGAQPYHDAVQIAIAPRKTITGTSPTDPAERFEFLIVPTAQDSGACYRLASPGDPLGDTQNAARLTPEQLESGAKVAVARRDGKTIYEISLSFTPMRSLISPSEGREFRMSLLVHDPDGTGVRDWGARVGLKPGPDSRYAWSRWEGEKGTAEDYCDSKTSWGMCSSKY